MSQLHSSIHSSQSEPAADPYNFSSPPVLLLESVSFELIETADPVNVETQIHLVRMLCNEVLKGSTKQHGFKIPNPITPVPSFIQQHRKQLHNVIVDTFFKIIKKRRAVNRLEEHLQGLTFPPEYSSLKMPRLMNDPDNEDELNNFVNSRLLELKKEILLKHIATERKCLDGYSTMMSKCVVVEAYKSLAYTAHLETYASVFTDFRALDHILADYNILHQLCSQEVGRRLKQEADKRQKLQAAQALAAQQESTMSVKELVNHTVKLHLGSSRSKSPKPPKPKPKSTKGTPKNSRPSTPTPKGSGKNKSKKPAPGQKRTQAKQVTFATKKSAKPTSNLKGSAPKGSSSTSFRRQTGGKN